MSSNKCLLGRAASAPLNVCVPSVAHSAKPPAAARAVPQMARSSSMQNQQQSSTSDVVLEAMLENQRRRMQVRREMADLRREAQQAHQAAAHAAPGSKWWEVDCPPNMATARTPDDVTGAIAREARAGAAGRLVVVVFFSPECYGCRSLQPKLRQIAAERAGSAVFVKVNGAGDDALRAYCEAEGVTKIPFFRLYRAGALVAAFSANMQPDKLKLLRAQIADHCAGAGADGSSNGSSNGSSLVGSSSESKSAVLQHVAGGAGQKA